jgi:hypothetical protein
MISDRVARLRQQSLEAKPCISTERAELMTEVYEQQTGLMSAPLRRARSFQYLMEHKTIYLGPDELIVGEKAPRPKPRPLIPNCAVIVYKISTSWIRATRSRSPSARRRVKSTPTRSFPSGKIDRCATCSLQK